MNNDWGDLNPPPNIVNVGDEQAKVRTAKPKQPRLRARAFDPQTAIEEEAIVQSDLQHGIVRSYTGEGPYVHVVLLNNGRTIKAYSDRKYETLDHVVITKTRLKKGDNETAYIILVGSAERKEEILYRATADTTILPGEKSFVRLQSLTVGTDTDFDAESTNTAILKNTNICCFLPGSVFEVVRTGDEWQPVGSYGLWQYGKVIETLVGPDPSDFDDVVEPGRVRLWVTQVYSFDRGIEGLEKQYNLLLNALDDLPLFLKTYEDYKDGTQLSNIDDGDFWDKVDELKTEKVAPVPDQGVIDTKLEELEVIFQDLKENYVDPETPAQKTARLENEAQPRRRDLKIIPVVLDYMGKRIRREVGKELIVNYRPEENRWIMAGGEC